MQLSLVTLLICANVLMYLTQSAAPESWIYPLVLWPLASQDFQPWQVVTYAFLHTGPLHIFMNMFGLAVFGPILEHTWGWLRFLAYYLACVIFAGFTQLAFAAYSGLEAPTVGASGGLFGVLLAFAWLFPHERIYFILLPIPIPARIFVVLYAAVELALGVSGTATGIAHFAHLGGMVGGILFLLAWGGGRRAG